GSAGGLRPETHGPRETRRADHPAAALRVEGPPARGVTTAPVRGASVPLASELAERWDDIVAAARELRPFLGSALEKALPSAVTARGEVTLALEAPDEIAQQAIVSGAAEVTRVIGRYFDG